VKHLNDFSERLKLSGYNEEYRFQVIKSGVVWKCLIRCLRRKEMMVAQ